MPADAFYEWSKLDAKNKQPFAIAMKDGQSYALTGLWERWKDLKAGSKLMTFTVITTDPNEVVQPLHDRMPVIIPLDPELPVSDVLTMDQVIGESLGNQKLSATLVPVAIKQTALDSAGAARQSSR